jgi:hypothetical protein
MGIEGIYPYIAVAYGTFGIVFGVMLWWKTQRRIDRTKTAIEIQVANAVKDIGAKVDEKLDFDLPDIDTAPLMAKLDSMQQELPDMISNHIDMHMKALKGVEAKQLNEALADMGINLEAATAEGMAFAEAQLPPEMIAMKKLLTAKIPKKMREDNPTWAWLIEQARQAGGGLIMSRLQERAGIGGVAVESARGSIGVR